MESEAECAGGAHEGMPVERILEAELAVEPKTESYGDMSMESSVRALGAAHCPCGGCAGVPTPASELVPFQTNDPVTNICHAADKQLFTLVEWAKRIPHFSGLTLEDQVILLRAGRAAGPPTSGTVAGAALGRSPGDPKSTRAVCHADGRIARRCLFLWGVRRPSPSGGTGPVSGGVNLTVFVASG